MKGRVRQKELERRRRKRKETRRCMSREFPEKIISHSWGSHRVRIYETATQNNPPQRKQLGQ